MTQTHPDYRLSQLDQLEAEHRIKPEVREARTIGFLQ